MNIRQQNGRKRTYDMPNSTREVQSMIMRLSGLDENAGFCSNPNQYSWEYVGRQDMIVPYNCAPPEACPTEYPCSKESKNGRLRWERHNVWIVEGTLQRGESNILARRRFYLDGDTWLILLGEGYNGEGDMLGYYMLCHSSAATMNYRGVWYPIDEI